MRIRGAENEDCRPRAAVELPALVQSSAPLQISNIAGLFSGALPIKAGHGGMAGRASSRTQKATAQHTESD